MHCPRSSLRSCAATSRAMPWRNSFRKTSAALSSQGMSTPEPVHERHALAAHDVDAEGERGEAGEVADVLGDVLVERDGVAEAAAAGMRRGGEEADVGGVAAVDVRVRDAAEDGEVVAVLLEVAEVGRERVAAARRRWGRSGRAAGRGCCRCRGSAAAVRVARSCRTPGSWRRAAAGRG